ncbi:MAG: hypothetical protein EHM64_02935 [Ignavibacteriae bacterium]|nr:MAG: hypothetical protein EHM64_02935 [Ignavibacteriota bacterium]
MKPIAPSAIVVALFLAFFLFSIAGIKMMWDSQIRVPADPTNNSPSKIGATVDKDSVKIDITTASLGAIVFVFGASGLILLLIKVPVKRILGYEKQSEGSTMDRYSLSLPLEPTPILSSSVERLPLLLWILLRRKGIAVKAD